MSSTIQATSLSQFSAALFARLPAELNLHILSYCQRNDLICLSLVSHYFRDIVLPMIPSRPPLQQYDQNIAKEDFRCGCNEPLPVTVQQNTRLHRKRMHDYRSDQSGNRLHWEVICRAYPEGHEVCKIRGCNHCMCISCPLHTRLRTWIGGDLQYCTECRRFTKRETTKKYKGRCLHGRAKVRRSSNNHWTAVKGQSYGQRWWRRWGTSGVDRWAFDDDKHKRDDPTAWTKTRNPRVV